MTTTELVQQIQSLTRSAFNCYWTPDSPTGHDLTTRRGRRSQARLVKFYRATVRDWINRGLFQRDPEFYRGREAYRVCRSLAERLLRTVALV